MLFLPSVLLLLVCLSSCHETVCHHDFHIPSDYNITKLISKPTESYKITEDWVDKDTFTHNYIAIYQGVNKFYKTSPIISNLHIVVSFPTEETARIKILDLENKRWEIPEEDPFPHFKAETSLPRHRSCCDVSIKYEPFSFSVRRKDSNEVLFETKDRKFIFSDLYIELSTASPSRHIYGLGERTYKFKLDPGIYSFWSRDDAEIVEKGTGGGNLYGHHPVALIRGNKENFYVAAMRNSNAMDVIVDYTPGVTYKMIGGIVDLIFFVGDNYPDTVIKTYHQWVGGFVMMPFWSLGYHQSRWGYNTRTTLTSVLQNFKTHDIPIDVIWSDIDYMIDKEDFTIDVRRFPIDEMKQMLKTYKKRWVPIIDAGIKIDPATIEIRPTYSGHLHLTTNHRRVYSRGASEGIRRDIFIKSGDGGNLLSKVWPGAVYFPDFFHPRTDSYWAEMLEDLYSVLSFAGIWLDMNEVASFVNGETNLINGILNDNPSRRTHGFSDIPYVPGNRPLETKTLSLDAVHYGGLLEYNVHQLYSILQAKSTYNYLKTKSKLPFILSRGNSFGMGKYAFHWSGDIAATWSVMGYSIPGIFNFQLFGIPMIGADICGFFKSTTPELCLRWYQVGAFYPFARNHNHDQSVDQEPWAFLDENLGYELLGTARASLKIRYSILKWYYSLFIATKGLGTVFRPLFFDFPHEEDLYWDHGPSESQFLLGSSLMCTPKLEASGHKVKAYFPKVTWYDFFSGEMIIEKDKKERFTIVKTSYNMSAPLFIRAGHTVHTQDVQNVLSTDDLNDEFELVVAFGRGEGYLKSEGRMLGVKSFDENTISDKCIDKDCFYEIESEVIEESQNNVIIKTTFKAHSDSKSQVGNIGIFGFKFYGLPLNLNEADKLKGAYGVGMVINKENQTTNKMLVKQVIQTSQGSFAVTLTDNVRISDGYSIVVELII